MTGPQDISQGKSIGDLGREASWFLTHTSLAVLMLVAVIVGMTMIATMDHDQLIAVIPSADLAHRALAGVRT